MLRRTLPLSLLLFTGIACSNRPGLRQKAAVIEASPNPILFQPLAVGKTALVGIQIRNAGNLDLHLGKDPSVVEADNDGFTEYETPITLAKDCASGDRKVDTRLTIVPGDCAVLVLRYAPKNDADKDDAQLKIETDASNTTRNNPYVTVGLSGAPAPPTSTSATTSTRRRAPPTR